jgi:N-acetylglutamate synthase-like GNAT family acetyltransferase
MRTYDAKAVREFYEEQGYGGGVHIDDELYVTMEQSKIIGALRLAPENNTLVLRAMFVASDWQRRGVGSALLKEVEPNIVRECYCLPHGYLEGFYGQIGFCRIEPEQAPSFLQARLAASQAKWGNIIIMKRPGPVTRAAASAKLEIFR